MLDLKIKPQELIITNKHKGFKGTEYEKSDFAIKMKSLGATELFDSISKNTIIENGIETTNNIGMITDQLSNAIISWEGIYSGGEVLPCDKETMIALFNYSYEFANLLLTAFTDEMTKKDIKKK